ncbi:hypothetical protein ACFLRN_00360 [Thermoproteota archaeon]
MQRLDTKKLALASMLGALAAASEAIKGPPFDIPFPLLPGVVSWDLTGVPMTMSLLVAGPLAAVYTCVIGCSIIFLRGNVGGGLLKLIAELATILAFAAICRGFIPKTIAAVTSRVLVMTAANYYLLPIFWSKYYPSEATVIVILLPLAAFNISQALLNIIPAQLIYSRLDGWWRLRGQETKPLDYGSLNMK